MSTNTQPEHHLAFAKPPFVRAAIVYNALDASSAQFLNLPYSSARSLADYVGELPEPQHWAVCHEGRIVEPDEWTSVFPKPLSLVTVVRVPQAGAASATNKKVLRIAALITLMVAAPYLAPLVIPGSIAGITISAATATSLFIAAGAAVINAVLPPNAGLKSNSEGNTYGVDGPKNTSAEGIPVPVVYGKHRVGGNIIDIYTRNVGDDQYLYLRTALNDGEVEEISNVEINDQPASYWNAKEPGSVEVRYGMGLETETPNDWFDESIRMISSQQVITTNYTTLRTSGPVDKLRVDLLFPSGLYFAKDDGRKLTQTVTLVAQMRTINPANNTPTGDWTSFPLDTSYEPYLPQESGEILTTEDYLIGLGFTGLERLSSGAPSFANSWVITDNTSSAKRLTYQTPTIPRAAYEVRIKRMVAAEEGTKSHTDVYVTDLGEIDLEPVNMNGVANLSLKIKLNDTMSNVPTVTALVKGSKVYIYDDDGNIVDYRWSDNPSHIVTDILHNPLRGGGYSLDRQIWAKANDFADFCEANDFRFNGVFDETRSIWDSAILVAKVGRATVFPRGTKLTFVVDEPSDPQMIFTSSEMLEGSFKKTWVSIDERANEFHYQFADEEDGYKRKTVRITDDVAINRGDRLKVSTINGFGVTNLARAVREANYHARGNAYLRQTIEFDAPLRSIGLNIGQVALIQHDSVNFKGGGGGKTAAGSTSTSVALDRPVTVEAGKEYALLVVHDAVQRYAVNIQSKSGDRLAVTGFPASDPQRCQRIIQGERDAEILRISTGSGGLTYITVDDGSDFTPGAATLWDTDVIEERVVSSAPGTHETVTLSSALSKAPSIYSTWLFGVRATVQEPFRLRRIKGTDLDSRTLSWVQYDERVYEEGSFGTIVIDKPVRTEVAHVSQLTATYAAIPTADQERVPVNISWVAPADLNYGGADVYVRYLPTERFEYLASAQNVTSIQRDFSRGVWPTFKVVCFDKKNVRALADTAPTCEISASIVDTSLTSMSALSYEIPYYKGSATARLSWSDTGDRTSTLYRVERAPLLASQLAAFNQYIVDQAAHEAAANANPNDALVATQLPLPFALDFEVVGTSPETAINAPNLNVGLYAFRVRGEKAFAASLWAYMPVVVSAAELPSQITGLRLSGAASADVASASFSTPDASWTWNDIAAQSSGAAAEAAYNFLDYKVSILTEAGSVIRTEYTKTPAYTYSFAKNAADAALAGVAPRRSFRIEVAIRGLQSQVSSARTMLAQNAAPAAPTGVAAAPSVSGIDVSWAASTDSDFAETYVWVGASAGFAPSDANLVFKGKANKTTAKVTAGNSYIKVGHSDVFGAPANLTSVGPITVTTAGADALQAVADAKTAADNAMTGLTDPTTGAYARLTRIASKSDMINPNGDFVDWGNTELPTNLVKWQTGTVTRHTGVAGDEIGFAVAGGQEGGFAWENNVLPKPIGGRWYVFEADFTLVSGSLDGSGLLVYVDDGVAPTPIKQGELHVAFKKEFGAGVVGSNYRYRSKPFKLTDSTASTRMIIHAMNHWVGFESPYSSVSAANSIRWGSCKLKVASAIESAYTNDIFVRDQAVGRISTLETRSQVRPNLLKNSDAAEAQSSLPHFPKYFGGATDFFGRGYDPKVGSYFVAYANNSGSGKVLVSDGYDIDAGSTLSFSLYGDGGEDYATLGQQAYVYINFRNASTGVWDLDSTTVNPAWRVFLDSRDWLKLYELPNITIPAGKNGWRFVYATPNGHAGSTFSRIMANVGMECVAYNTLGTQFDNVARIRQTELTQVTQGQSLSALQTGVAASLAAGSAINNNNDFAGYTNPTGSPDYWWDWAAGSMSYRVSGRGARYAVRASATAGSNQGHGQTIFLTPGKYVLTADVRCESGDWSGAGIWMDYWDDPAKGLDFCRTADTAGLITPGGGSSGSTRRFTKVVTVTHTGFANIYMMNNWDGWGLTRTAKDMIWYECSLRLVDAGATLADAKAETALYALTNPEGSFAAYQSEVNARFTNPDGDVMQAKADAISTAASNAAEAISTYNQSVSAEGVNGLSAVATAALGGVVTLEGKTYAYLKYTAAAGGQQAYVSITAGDGSSLIDMRAKKIVLGDEAISVLEISGGVARITNAHIGGAQIDDLTVGSAKIAKNAITNFAAAESSAQIIVETAWQTLIDVSITTTGGVVSVDAGAFISGNGTPVPSQAMGRVVRDSTVIWGPEPILQYTGVQRYYLPGLDESQYVDITLPAQATLHRIATDRSAPAGSHIYKLQVSGVEVVDAPYIRVQEHLTST